MQCTISFAILNSLIDVSTPSTLSPPPSSFGVDLNPEPSFRVFFAFAGGRRFIGKCAEKATARGPGNKGFDAKSLKRL